MKQHSFSHGKFFATLEDIFISSDFYWQTLSLLACFILAFLFYKINRRLILPRITSGLKGQIEINRVISKYVIPMLYPLFVTVFLSIALAVYSQFFKEVLLLAATLKLMTLFLFLRFLRIASGVNFVANAVGLFLVPALLLDVFGLLETTINYLDQYALKLGNFRISIFILIKTFITLSVVFCFANLIGKKSKHYVDASKSIKSSNKTIIIKIIDTIIYVIVAIILLKTVGVDMTTFALIGGAVGVGIGFGLQKIASNFISGIILLFEKSIKIGDCIELENSSVFGNIRYLGSRYTLIECPDGREIMVPNEDLITNRVINWTYSNNRARVQLDFAVAHDSNLEIVKEVAIAAAKETPRCLVYPEVECFFYDIGEFSVKVRLYFWISDINESREPPKSDVIMSLWKKLREHGIKVPYPQREVRVVE